jgi:hypothetical protein
MHHRGTEATKGSIAVHDTSYAPDERFDVEVDQETEPEIEQLQVCKELSAVNRVERLDSLHFDNQPPLDAQIDSIRRGYADTVVPKRHAMLLDPRQSSQRELMTQTRLVARLRSPGPGARCTSMAAPMTCLDSIGSGPDPGASSVSSVPVW